MLTDFLIINAITTTTTLVWRALLLDHSRLLEKVRQLPIIGSALSCGFCATVWFSLIAVLIQNPLSTWQPELPILIQLFVGWFTLSAGVLLLRNLIAVLMEGNGVLTNMHRNIHEKGEK
jgi:hypothetical protein